MQEIVCKPSMCVCICICIRTYTYIYILYSSYFLESTEERGKNSQALRNESLNPVFRPFVQEKQRGTCSTWSSLETGCSPSCHWLVWLRGDLSRFTAFKLTLNAIMYFKVDELWKKKGILFIPVGSEALCVTWEEGGKTRKETSFGSRP